MIFYFSVAAAVTAHCADSHVATTAITNSVAAVLLSRLLPSPPLRLAGTWHQWIVDSKFNSCCRSNNTNHDATSTADWSMPSSASWFLFLILYFIAAVAVAPYSAVATSVTATNLFLLPVMSSLAAMTLRCLHCSLLMLCSRCAFIVAFFVSCGKLQ